MSQCITPSKGAFETILEADPVRFEELFGIITTALMVLTQFMVGLVGLEPTTKGL